MKNISFETVVKELKMERLWDHDYIKEDYGSEIMISIDERKRPLYNWCYYLIPEGSIFPLHKLLSDESWQFCLGGSIDLHLIKDGEIETIRIGPNIVEKENLFYIVKRNTWFAATPAKGSEYTLITHCVSPGWAPEDDIPGFYNDMIKLAPKYPDFIKKFSWPDSRKEYIKHESYKDNKMFEK